MGHLRKADRRLARTAFLVRKSLGELTLLAMTIRNPASAVGIAQFMLSPGTTAPSERFACIFKSEAQ
jgi:hypothetical protein